MSRCRTDNTASTRTIRLTEDEAMSLLEVCLNTACLDNPVRLQVLAKLGDTCRDFMRKDQTKFRGMPVDHTISPASPNIHPIRYRTSNRRWVRSGALCNPDGMTK